MSAVATKRVRPIRRHVRPAVQQVRVRVVYAEQDDPRGMRALVDVIKAILG